MALNDTPLRDRTPAAKETDQSEYERKLVDRLMDMVTRADANEEVRRRSDRIGANLFYGRHYNVKMPQNRAAITLNFVKPLIQHKIAIMTKLDPVPVIEATEFGDAKSADLLRQVVIKWWRDSHMKNKLVRAVLLANTTRTSAMKMCWDVTQNGGAGDVACDVVPGWRMILDDRADTVERMEFIGHREQMRRSEAALMYPSSSKAIYAGVSEDLRGTQPQSGGDMPITPLGDPWRRMARSNASFSTIVNGKPLITAYTMGGASARPGGPAPDMVQIVELFHRDRTLVQTRERTYDIDGNPKSRIVRGEDGMPQFRDAAPEIVPQDDGSVVELPGFELVMEPVYEDKLVPKYPHWRRSTFLLPDMVLVDDRAWDGPAPFALFSDGDALEGPWVKGCALDVEDPQMAVNVSVSCMADNLRMNSYRPVVADTSSGIEGNTLTVKPGQIIRVNGGAAALQPFQFPDVTPSWFQWIEMLLGQMERIIGAQGVMQGEAAGRLDSAAGYDLLAEIGGSRIVACTRGMEESIADMIRVAAWFMQRHYTDKHAIAVSDAEGNISEEKLGGAFLAGSFNFSIATGSTMAWSESAVKNRLLTELNNGLIDKIAYWQRSNTPGWQDIQRRLAIQPPNLSGAAASPPPRTRTTPNAATAPKT